MPRRLVVSRAFIMSPGRGRLIVNSLNRECHSRPYSSWKARPVKMPYARHHYNILVTAFQLEPGGLILLRVASSSFIGFVCQWKAGRQLVGK